MRKIFDNIGVLFWFAMDCCWMMEKPNIAYFFMVLGLITLVVYPVIVFKSKVDIGVFLSTAGWFCMNSLWLIEDLNTISISTFFEFKIIFLICAIAGFIITIFEDINKLKKIRKFNG